MNVGRLIAVVFWLFVGHIVLGGVYWGLLNVPESNAIMLIVSALLALVLVVGASVIETTGLLWLRREWTLRGALARSLRALPAFLIAFAIWLVVHVISRRSASYHELHGSELDAWLIATFDWTNTAWLHRAIDWVFSFIEYVIGTSLAVSALSAAAAGSTAALLRFRWFTRAFGWRVLAAIAVAMFGLVWLPWQAVYWRPASLPASSMQIAFAVAKLAVLGLVMHVGWALVLWAPQLGERGAPAAAVPAPLPAAPLPPQPAPATAPQTAPPASPANS